MQNLAPTDKDLTHPAYFRRQVYKQGGVRRGCAPPDKTVARKNVGQPGCTDREREDFQGILDTGGLVDAFRQKHPSAEEFTWRELMGGTLTGRGMRIDHCIASCSLLDSIRNVEVVSGKAPHFKGFMGSDHCPLLVDINNEQ